MFSMGCLCYFHPSVMVGAEVYKFLEQRKGLDTHLLSVRRLRTTPSSINKPTVTIHCCRSVKWNQTFLVFFFFVTFNMDLE
ncbi:hypothetical protein OUZ56_002654 [Daphnia magna]|uniref:Secreted protein n=1 Tax=Daphnia magna TaxID=35525 RepID=A0ABR0A6L9_9CRUS|nr:hypothetical protein OUZ56_002654 [Daphnia magna]